MNVVYAIKNIYTDGMYVGSTSDLYSRWSRHRHDLKKGIHWSKKMQADYNKFGLKSFHFERIEHVTNKDILINREQVWLNFFNPSYNTCKIAGTVKGLKHSEETIEKLRRASTGRVGYWNGKKKSPETIKKMSLANIGKRYSEETNKKKGLKGMLNPYYGKKHSDEIKRKMSEAQKMYRESLPPRLIYQYDLSRNLISVYNGYEDLENKTGVSKKSVVCAISSGKPRRKTIWSYKEL